MVGRYPTSQEELKVRQILRIALFWIVAPLSHEAAAQPPPDAIIVPRFPDAQDTVRDYALDLLRLALDKGGIDAPLSNSTEEVSQDRFFREIERDNGTLDIIWGLTSSERESRAIAVPIPLDRGLFGWRLLLVSPHTPASLSAVNGPDDLAQYKAGQMTDWLDTKILRANGLSVATVQNYESLFKMLQQGRIDYFPRSILEIDSELRDHRNMGLKVEPNLVLHYPTAFYFFVRHGREELATTLENGLRKAIADGSFKALFYRHFGKTIQSWGLDKRTVIQLINPMAPPSPSPEPLGLMYHPGDPS